MYRICVLLLLLLPLTATAEDCPKVKLQVERLPDLNIPRGDHSVFVANGEPTVVGGHTNGFVPTATAEYYSNGEWHLLETVYSHDHGFSVLLESGQGLIGGGHSEPLGIGHTHSVEMYDPVTHTFRGFGCLDNKRCFATAQELDSGRVIITGNWFNDDSMERFDGQKYFTHARKVSQVRACPYVFPIDEDDVIAFCNMDEHGNPFDTIIVDRLKGEPFRVPLFDEWKPLGILIEKHSDNHRIGENAYVFHVMNKEGQIAICRVEGTEFSLLPTAFPFPTEHDNSRIIYNHNVCVDHKTNRACFFGRGKDNNRLYVTVVDLTKSPCPVTLYYTDPVEPIIWSQPILTANGDLLIAGGVKKNVDDSPDNFSPVATTLLLSLGNHTDTAATTTAHHNNWLWIGLGLLAIGIFIISYKTYSSHKTKAHLTPQKPDNLPQDASTSNLMQRICQLMDEQKPYLDDNLKLQNIADLLGTNRTYIADCIKSFNGQTFTQFVNTYRIDYAKKLLREHPEKKMSAVATESGFTTESHFFRTFKAVAGMTPNEWRAQQNQS